ncbi:hypothetical protein [Halosimplex halobium]|uniref:hypothetical protein n=1 Tax=Halosimplex halobium TaxID=3396618 RepID=UPI003F54BA2F
MTDPLVGRSVRETFLDRLRIFVRAFERGLAQDRSSIDGVVRLLTRPTQFPEATADPGLWIYGLQYRPVALGLLFTCCALAAATTLAACQQLRALRRQGAVDDLAPMEWMRVTSALFQDGAQLRRGNRLLGGATALGAGAVVLGLGQYYFLLADPGIRHALRAFVADLFIALLLVVPLTLLVLPFVGAPVAYLYVLSQAWGMLTD